MMKPVAAMLALVLVGCARQKTQPRTRPLSLKGSDTMVLLGQRWAETFMTSSDSTRVQVTGGGSGTGIAALINGGADLAMSSRAISDAEKRRLSERGADAVETTVARDGIVFYVHESNPVGSLSTDELRDIYLGDVTRWSEVGGADEPIVVYSRENSSGTYVFVKEAVLGGEDFTSRALTLPGTAAVINAVSKDPRGVGYGGAGFARGVRALTVRVGDEHVSPTLDHVRSGKYPLARDLFIYTRGEPSADARALLDFALSDAGQSLVAQAGYFPLR